MTSLVNPRIFRAYDIRGVADVDLNDAAVDRIGDAYARYLRERGKQRIALGRDCRLSSERIADTLRETLLRNGLDVVDIGVGPTPLLYFAVFHLALDGGVQITGSHNPSQDNGLKLLCGRHTLSGDEIQTLRRLAEDTPSASNAHGTLEPMDLTPAYVGYMRGNLRLARTDIGFALDAGNGAGGPLALETMRALGLAPDPLYCDMDGHFPHHHPDPTVPANLADLIRRVRDGGHELGLALDGDADRLGVVDRHGGIVWGDRLMIVLARRLLERQPGAAVLGDVKCSQTLYDDVAAHGGRPIIWKTGHSLIKQKMRDEQALLAGEMSGHLFFADRYYGYDDAIYAALRLLEQLAETDQSLDELLADVPKTFATPELRVACDDARKFDIVNRVLERYRATHDVLDVDGARVRFDGGWGLVRASNTEPALVLRFEATSEDALQRIRSEVEGLVSELRG